MYRSRPFTAELTESKFFEESGEVDGEISTAEKNCYTGHGRQLSRTKDMSSTESESQQDSVVYNPKQQVDRDLSVMAIKVYGEENA